MKEILNGLKITNTARKHLYIAFVSAALSLLSLLAVFLLFADLIYVFQESVWDEFHEIKERIAKQEPSQDLIVVEYDLQSYKKLGPLEGNIDLWRKTILRIAESAKAVAIDCGIGPEDVQEIPPFRLKEIPVNVVFPLHAYGISTRGNVITAVSWKPLCIDYFRNASLNYGHTVYFIDSDGIARKVPSQILVGNDTKPALSIAALRIFGRKDIKIVEAGGNSLLLAGKKRVLLERGLTFRPEFIPYERFKRISFAEVAGGDFPYETLKGKLVLVGINLPNWGLQYLYPLSKQKLSSSLVLQANIVNSLMKGNIYTVQPKSLFVLLVCFTVVILSVVYSRTNVLTSTVVAISSLVAWELFCLVQYLRYTLVDPILVPFGIITSFAFAHALMHAQEAKEKHMVESIFSRYLKPEIVKRIVENPEKALETLKGTTRLATVLFADIRGFTTFCENRKPEEVVRTLNEIFEVTTEMIFSEDGMIDKFIGDGVMVLFNIPDDQEDHADRAVRAAIKIMKALEERKSGLSFGIGINTGVVVAGNIGSSKRMEYTAIGDVVNTASRICSVAGKGEILISEHTKKMLNDGFRLEDAGEYALKGKSGKLRLFRVIYDYN